MSTISAIRQMLPANDKLKRGIRCEGKINVLRSSRYREYNLEQYKREMENLSVIRRTNNLAEI